MDIQGRLCEQGWGALNILDNLGSHRALGSSLAVGSLPALSSSHAIGRLHVLCMTGDHVRGTSPSFCAASCGP